MTQKVSSASLSSKWKTQETFPFNDGLCVSVFKSKTKSTCLNVSISTVKSIFKKIKNKNEL